MHRFKMSNSSGKEATPFTPPPSTLHPPPGASLLCLFDAACASCVSPDVQVVRRGPLGGAAAVQPGAAPRVPAAGRARRTQQ